MLPPGAIVATNLICTCIIEFVRQFCDFDSTIVYMLEIVGIDYTTMKNLIQGEVQLYTN